MPQLRALRIAFLIQRSPVLRLSHLMIEDEGEHLGAGASILIINLTVVMLRRLHGAAVLCGDTAWPAGVSPPHTPSAIPRPSVFGITPPESLMPAAKVQRTDSPSFSCACQSPLNPHKLCLLNSLFVQFVRFMFVNPMHKQVIASPAIPKSTESRRLLRLSGCILPLRGGLGGANISLLLSLCQRK